MVGIHGFGGNPHMWTHTHDHMKSSMFWTPSSVCTPSVPTQLKDTPKQGRPISSGWNTQTKHNEWKYWVYATKLAACQQLPNHSIALAATATLCSNIDHWVPTLFAPVGLVRSIRSWESSVQPWQHIWKSSLMIHLIPERHHNHSSLKLIHVCRFWYF